MSKPTNNEADTFEYWVDQAAKGRNKAECWQECQRIAHQELERVREGAVAIVKKGFYDFNDKETDFDCNQKVLQLRNSIVKALTKDTTK